TGSTRRAGSPATGSCSHRPWAARSPRRSSTARRPSISARTGSSGSRTVRGSPRRSSSTGLLVSEAPARERLDQGLPLDRRLDVELLAGVRLLADQLTRPARQLLLRVLARLPQVHGAPALGRLVRDPRLEAQAGHVFEGVHRLVVQVAAQLLDRRL